MAIEWTEEKISRIFELAEQGMTHKQIGDKIGCSKSSVRSQIVKNQFRQNYEVKPVKQNFRSDARFTMGGITPAEIDEVKRSIRPLDRINIVDLVKRYRSVECEKVTKTNVLGKYAHGITVMIEGRLRFYRYDSIKKNEKGIWHIRRFGAYEIQPIHED